MTRSILQRWLEADRDGELRGWRRGWLQRALARSPELRAERVALDALGQAVRDAGNAVRIDPVDGNADRPSLWSRLEVELDRIDRRVPASDRLLRSTGDRDSSRSYPWTLRDWIPAGAMAGAAVAVLAVGLWWSGAVELPEVDAVASGRLRTLDTGDRSVWVQETEEATIIWLVDDRVDVGKV